VKGGRGGGGSETSVSFLLPGEGGRDGRGFLLAGTGVGETVSTARLACKKKRGGGGGDSPILYPGQKRGKGDVSELEKNEWQPHLRNRVEGGKE